LETWDAIRSRRNVRSFTDEPISETDLDQILEAGRRTPSSRNEQRWELIVVTDKEQLERLSQVWRGAAYIVGSAATLALVAPVADDPRVRESIQYDLGQLTMSISLAAADLGIGAGHASVHDQEAAREALGFPEGYFCAWLIALGHPADRPIRVINKPTRRPFDEVVHRGGW
jgi:nitroreductase